MGSNGHWISVFLFLCKLLLCAFSSMLFLLSFYIRNPKRFYPSYPVVSTVAINDNNHQHTFVACSMFANNLISEEVVKRLDLPTTPHPQPYTIGWFRQGSDLRISQQCRLSYGIKPFKDEVLCDVAPLEFCDVLFGLIVLLLL